MKKILSYILFGILGIVGFSACSDSETYPTPTALDASSLSYEAKAGAVKLKWAIPENANYKYVKITYTLPESGKECMRLASVYSDTCLVDNLLKRYGDIVFTLQPCSPDGNGGEVCTITAQADAAEKQIKTTSKSFTITGTDDAWTDAQEPSEGPLKNLFDGDTSTYFHMQWSGSPTGFPHYIVVDLKDEISYFNFTYTTRDHNNNDHPASMDILVSKELGGSKPDYINETGTTKVASLTSGLPTTRKATYQSDKISSDEGFRYVWFKITSSASGNNYIALSELAVTQVTTTIYDPETGETTAN